ncbi:MAG: hypothetical protein ABI629_20480 [bacterium]
MKLYFVGFEQANVGDILPVLEALRAHPRLEPVFVPGTDFKPHRGLLTARPPAGIDAQRLESALDSVQVADAERRARRLCGEARRWTASEPAARSVHQRLLAAQLDRYVRRPEMASLFRAYTVIERAADAWARRERPRVVVLSEDSDYLRGRLLARVFAAHGVHIVCLTPWYYSTFRSYPLVGARQAHAYLVGTPAHARRLLASGVARRCVHVVGHPGFDALAAQASPTPPPGHFLYALQGLPWEREIASDLQAAVGEHAGARLTIKPHPQLPLPTWLVGLSRRTGLRTAPARQPAIELVRDTHCVVAQTSRLLFEASLLGRRVIVPHYDATPLRLEVPDRDAPAAVAHSPAELGERVRAVLRGRGRALSGAAIAPYHPHATQRAVQVLEELALTAGSSRAAPTSRTVRRPRVQSESPPGSAGNGRTERPSRKATAAHPRTD